MTMTPELREDMRKCALMCNHNMQWMFSKDFGPAARVLAWLDAEDAAPDFSHVADGYVEADAMDADDGYIGVSVA